MNTVQTPENIIKIILFPGELAVRDQRPPNGDILLLLPGDAVPHGLLVVQLHDRPLAHHHLLLLTHLPSGFARVFCNLLSLSDWLLMFYLKLILTRK